jgi:pimeloyl-ACP methyl ester carboxylesterase
MDDPDCTLINCENQLWEPNRNDDLRKLYLDQYGQSTTTYDIYTRDVIDEINVLPIGQGNIYKSFIASMNTLKTNGTINAWEAVPYDWRLSIADIMNGGIRYGNDISYVQPATRSYIIDELRALAAHSKTGKVTIIAHSNGGLVTKALMKKLKERNEENLVDKIIFVAVPQTGTPEAIGALLHGANQGHFPVITTAAAREFTHHIPAASNLLPSEAYFTGTSSHVNTPVVTFEPGSQTALFRNAYGDQINTYGAMQAFLRGLEGGKTPIKVTLPIPAY